jgi:plasmid stabilization system protein ParE
MKVRFSEEAAQRYDAVLGYIREQNPLAADRMVTAVHRSLRRLRDFPLHRDGKPTPVPSRNEKGTTWGKRREKRVDDPASTVRSQSLHCSF